MRTVPLDIAPSSAARCEIDLSGGAVSSPASAAAGAKKASLTTRSIRDEDERVVALALAQDRPRAVGEVVRAFGVDLAAVDVEAPRRGSCAGRRSTRSTARRGRQAARSAPGRRRRG